MKLWLIGFLLVTYAASILADNTLSLSKPLHKIAFGSCAKQFETQPIWDSIALLQPDLFLFLGDNIYGDCDGEKAFTPTAETLERDWKLLANETYFRAFRKQVPIMATWDNHDYFKD